MVSPTRPRGMVWRRRSSAASTRACAELGLSAEANRLEEEARALGFEGYGHSLDPFYARLALLRGSLDEVTTLLEQPADWLWVNYSHARGATARLEALVAVGRTDEVEVLATRLSQPGTYLEPFALRALGLVRRDGALLAQAMNASRRWDSTGTPRRRAPQPRRPSSSRCRRDSLRATRGQTPSHLRAGGRTPRPSHCGRSPHPDRR
jgi:hypothetical protein